MVWSLVSIALNLACNKNKLYKSLDYWSRDMLSFGFLVKALGIISPPHFLYNFLRKICLMLYSTDWPNFIVWLPLLREILGNMCIEIVCFLGCDVINFPSLSLYSSHFSTWPKSQNKNLNTLRMKRTFNVEWKAFFITFKKVSVARNYHRPESSLLI